MMKNKVYRTLFMLTIILSAFNSQAETITGVSDPFQFGDPNPVPLSGYVLLATTGMIVFYVFRRFLKKQRHQITTK